MSAISGHSLFCGVVLTLTMSNSACAETLIAPFALMPRDSVIEASVNDCLGVYHTMNQRMLDKLAGFDVKIGDGVRLYPEAYKKATDALKTFWEKNARHYSPDNTTLRRELQTLVDALTAANQTAFNRGVDEWGRKNLSRLNSDFLSERFRLREQLDDVTYAWAQCSSDKAGVAACRSGVIRQFEQYFQDAHKVLGQFLPRLFYASVPMESEWWVACRAPDLTGSRQG